MQSGDVTMADSLLNVYLAWFGARTDLYVKNAAMVIQQPLTSGVIRNAIDHHDAISAYTATDQGDTWVGAIDFDTADGLAQARLVSKALAEAKVPSLLAHSRRGAHIWLTCWDVVRSSQMRKALNAAIHHAGLLPDDQIEVFPKPGNGLAAGALRLPGMPHQRTKQVYPIEMLDDDRWLPVGPDLIDLLEAHLPCEKADLLALAASYKTKQPYPKGGLGTFYSARPARDFGPEPSASAHLQRLWGLTVRPGGTTRCPLHDDRRGSLSVMRDDTRVYCGSPACVLHGGGHGVGSVALERMDP